MDHERVSIRTTTMSCGVMELSRINDDIQGVLYQIAGRLYHPSRGDPIAAFVFSDLAVPEPTNSSRLVRNIEKMSFGKVINSEPIENPKTGNLISVYTWLVDHENFKKWYSEERVRRMKKVGN